MNRNVVIEFFDTEPIENIITCLNFKMDYVVYIGYPETMTKKRREDTVKVLFDMCDIPWECVEYVEVNDNTLSAILETIQQILVREADKGNQCFIDITGGEDLIMVALGQASVMYRMPMHRFNIVTNELNVLNPEIGFSIKDRAICQHLNMSTDKLLRMYGARINYGEQSRSRTIRDDKGIKDVVYALWDISAEDSTIWNCMCGVINKLLAEYSTDKMCINVPVKKYLQIYKEKVKNVSNELQWNIFIDKIKNAGCIKDYNRSSHNLSFAFTSETARDLLTNQGLALELHTYFEIQKSGKYDECIIGAHVDWDGKIHEKRQGNACYDVENEIDIIARKGNIMTFISCKNGAFKKEALYELDTVVSHFSRKYIQKCVVAAQELKPVDVMRAEEMGIAIIESKRKFQL